MDILVLLKTDGTPAQPQVGPEIVVFTPYLPSAVLADGLPVLQGHAPFVRSPIVGMAHLDWEVSDLRQQCLQRFVRPPAIVVCQDAATAAFDGVPGPALVGLAHKGSGLVAFGAQEEPRLK